MGAQDVALEHYRQRAALAAAAESVAAQAWSAVDPDAISASWAEQVPTLTAATATAQSAAAGTADAYVAEALAEQGIDPTSVGRLNPRSLAGIASDGRALSSLLAQPGIAALTAIGGGATVEQAMATGLASARMIVATQVADAGRAADSIALTTRKAATGYVRVVVGKTCSRCIVLAGKFYRWNDGFDRHPKCDCIHLPSAQAEVAGLKQDPRRVFDSLSRADQDRVFTESGARAIRDGADVAQVVNARKGMYTAGRQTLTRTGAGRRGQRLMPEEIYKRAAGDRDEAIRLLRQHRYIADAPRPRNAPPPDRWATARTGEPALRAATANAGRRLPGNVALTGRQQAALRDYISSFFTAINGGLRRGTLGPVAARAVGHIDEVMAASRLAGDALVWRGVADGSKLFGARLGQDLAGFEWLERGYVSTSASRRIAQGFTFHQEQVLMRILAPRGTGAVQLSGMYDQAELLLQRGLRMRVVRDRGVSPEGYRLIDVEVVPA